MNSNAVVIALLGVTLAATLFVAANQEVSHDTGLTERLDAMDQRLQRLESLVSDTREEARRATRAASARRATTSPPDAQTVGAGGGAAGDPRIPPTVLEEVVAESVQRTVERQMERMAAENRHRGGDGKWKPPLDEMAGVLDLTTSQQESLKGIFDAARDEAFVLLQTKRPDGGNLVDDFVADLKKSEDAGKAWGRLFVALTTKKVPGTNRTYLAALGESEQRIRGLVISQLDEAQARRFKSLNVDVFDVKTGHDPLGDYVRTALEQTGE
jgi:hypothetical protein